MSTNTNGREAEAMTEESLKPEEPVVEAAAVKPDDDEGEGEYQNPITSDEFRETVSDVVTYVKDAWLQPFRKTIRDGFAATEDFARGLNGKSKKKRD